MSRSVGQSIVDRNAVKDGAPVIIGLSDYLIKDGKKQ
jgi:hypothetical protein